MNWIVCDFLFVVSEHPSVQTQATSEMERTLIPIKSVRKYKVTTVVDTPASVRLGNPRRDYMYDMKDATGHTVFRVFEVIGERIFFWDMRGEHALEREARGVEKMAELAFRAGIVDFPMAPEVYEQFVRSKNARKAYDDRTGQKPWRGHRRKNTVAMHMH